MFIIIKSPGQEPEQRHNIENRLKAINKELDAENIHHMEVVPGIWMCYDADGFAKCLAPCMTDERAQNMYYGDVIFYALDAKEIKCRSLTQKEEEKVLNYIETYRADK